MPSAVSAISVSIAAMQQDVSRCAMHGSLATMLVTLAPAVPAITSDMLEMPQAMSAIASATSCVQFKGRVSCCLEHRRLKAGSGQLQCIFSWLVPIASSLRMASSQST